MAARFLCLLLLAACSEPERDERFDFPVGAPDRAGYYVDPTAFIESHQRR